MSGVIFFHVRPKDNSLIGQNMSRIKSSTVLPPGSDF
jgi:hypothetical protein